MQKIRFGRLALALSGALLGGGLTVYAQQEGNAPRPRQEREPMVWNMEMTAPGVPMENTFVFVGAEAGAIAQKNVKGAPYSAEAVTETIQTLADGNRIVRKNKSLIYRDSEGRTRRESAISTLGPWASAEEGPRFISITDPVAGFSYTLNPRTKTATKISLGGFGRGPSFSTASGGSFSAVRVSSGSGAAVATASAPAANVAVETRVEKYVVESSQGGAMTVTGAASATPDNGLKIERRKEDLGTQTMEGVSAQGTRNVTVYPAGFLGNERPLEVVDERWYSSELQTFVMTKHSDPRSGETTFRLTNINRSNPDLSLFEPPSDYKVTEPKIRTTVGPGLPRVAPAQAPAPARPEN